MPIENDGSEMRPFGLSESGGPGPLGTPIAGPGNLRAELSAVLDHLERVEICLARTRNALAAVKRHAERLQGWLPRD